MELYYIALSRIKYRLILTLNAYFCPHIKNCVLKIKSRLLIAIICISISLQALKLIKRIVIIIMNLYTKKKKIIINLKNLVFFFGV